jgi:hypothetical protein
MKGYVVGFDLSLTAPAAVALPLDWRPGAWGRMRHFSVSPRVPSTDDLTGQLTRYLEIADFAEAVVHEMRSPHPPQVFVEAYGFSRNTQHGSRIMESGGIVKARLYERFRVVMLPVVAASARKFFLGFNPTRPKYNAKVVIQDALHKCKMPYHGEDVADAFLVANYGLTECRVAALSIAASGPRKGRGA